VGTVSAFGLLASLAVASPLTSAAPAASAASAEAEECVTEVATDAAAGVMAQRCDQDVEVVGQRTSWQTVYAQPDGTMRLDTSIAAVRTQQDGEWVDVDNTVVEQDGRLTIAAPVNPMTFSSGDDEEPLATIERDGHTLSFDVPFDLPAPQVDDDQLTYPDVLPGVDLIVTVTPDATGFVEVFRVESPEAAQDPRLDTLRFPIEVSSGLDVVEAAGGFEARDGAGEAMFTSPAPTMWDSAVGYATWPPALPASGPVNHFARPEPQSGIGAPAGIPLPDRAVEPIGGETVVTMREDVDASAVTITPDEALLTSPDTVWPVYIDPPVSGGLQQYAAVRTRWGTKTGWVDEGVGICNQAVESTCSATFSSRLLWRFVGLDQVGALDPGNIISATFSAVGTHSYSCLAQPVSLYRGADFDSSTVVWDGGLSVHQSTIGVAHKDSCEGSPVRWIEFDALESAHAVAAGDATVLALGLYADEGSMAFWKRYRWDARYSVVYNRAPYAPNNLHTDNPSTGCAINSSRPFIRSTTPTLVAILNDPDGENQWGYFEIFNTATGAPVWVAGTAWQGSGTQHALTVSPGVLVDGRTYSWRVTSSDTNAYGPPSGTCEFSVDVSRPVAPSITAVAGQRAVYLENKSAGGLGLTGQFALSPGSSGDVVAYRYSFDSDALSTRVPVALGESTTISYTPTTSAGLHTLLVATEDRAGNVSDTRQYAFMVRFPGVWRLDEGNGTSATGTGYTGQRFPLTVSSSTTWVDGLLTASGFSTTDKALKFDAASDVAKTAGPVIATNVAYTVMAFVKADSVTGTTTAVSQDGVNTSQFELGILSDPACPTGTGICWGFTTSVEDSASTARARSMSAIPVQAGQWYHLAGVRTEWGVMLSVCSLGTTAQMNLNPYPVPAGAVPFNSSWNATGPMQVGRGHTGSGPSHPWVGTVDNVQVMDGPASIGKLRTTCAAVE
jgi:hypothetical protein